MPGSLPDTLEHDHTRKEYMLAIQDRDLPEAAAPEESSRKSRPSSDNTAAEKAEAPLAERGRAKKDGSGKKRKTPAAGGKDAAPAASEKSAAQTKKTRPPRKKPAAGEAAQTDQPAARLPEQSSGSGAYRDAELSSAHLPESPVLEESLRHGRHVAVLAASLFDQLADLHELDDLWRNRLVLAARLHDIGFVEGRKGHHKAGMRYIEEDLSLNMADIDRPFVALLVRYHRKAWPSRRHGRFAALARTDRRSLRRAAALLRIADALDYTHKRLVRGCVADIRPHRVVLSLDCLKDCPEERARVLKKGDLFADLFDRELECICRAG